MSGELIEKFKKKEYRDAFIEESIRIGIAHQIRTMREKDGLTQQELAEKVGTSQVVISRLEDPDYGRLNMKTLLRLASAFDVALNLRFISFGEFIRHWSDMSSEAFAAPSFAEEIASPPLEANHFGSEHAKILFFPPRSCFSPEAEETAPPEWTSRQEGSMEASQPTGLLACGS